jgi:hypothetical protein
MMVEFRESHELGAGLDAGGDVVELDLVGDRHCREREDGVSFAISPLRRDPLYAS